MEVTLNIPDDLALKFKGLKELLPEIVSMGRIESHPNFEFEAKELSHFEELSDFIEFLTTLPNPEQLLAYQTPPEMRSQISNFIDKQRTRELLPEEKSKLKQYEFLILVILRAKINAIDKLNKTN